MTREATNIELEPASNGAECLDLFDADDYDCIVSDFDMPGIDGLELLDAIRSDHPSFPFILFTGKGTEEIASQAVGAGVTDYLQKAGPEVYSVLANRITNAVEQFRSRHDLKRFKLAVEHAGHAIYMTDPDGKITYVNPVFEVVTGYSETEAVGQTPKLLNSGVQDAEYFQRLWETVSNGDVWYEEVVNRRSNGDRYTALQTIAPIHQPANGINGYVAIQQNISDY